MGYPENIRALSNITCGLAGFNNYMDRRWCGSGVVSSALGATGNALIGFARNNIAYDMAKSGYTIGQDINMFYGYGTERQNACAMMGLMSVYTPYMFFNSFQYCCPTYSTFTYQPYNEWHGYMC